MKPRCALPLVIVVAATGCFGMQVQSGRPTDIPGTGASPGLGGGNPIPRSVGNTPPANTSGQICRTTSIPRGWIAVDYVPSATCAPLSRNEPGPNAALIVNHLAQLPETVLTVCSDQRPPRNWERLPSEDGDAASTRCPRKPGDPRTGPTIMRIRRVR